MGKAEALYFLDSDGVITSAACDEENVVMDPFTVQSAQLEVERRRYEDLMEDLDSTSGSLTPEDLKRLVDMLDEKIGAMEELMRTLQ